MPLLQGPGDDGVVLTACAAACLLAGVIMALSVYVSPAAQQERQQRAQAQSEQALAVSGRGRRRRVPASKVDRAA